MSRLQKSKCLNRIDMLAGNRILSELERLMKQEYE